MERRNLKTTAHLTTCSIPEMPISHLLSVALVSKKFRKLLLTNPAQALTEGYRGEMFRLNATEQKQVLAIEALSLEDFAEQLIALPVNKSEKGKT